MKSEIILYALSLCVAAACVVATVNMLWSRLSAEKQFLALLTTEDAMRDLRQLRSRLMPDGVMTSAGLLQVTASLERWSSKLPAKERLLIERALYQRAMLGRARYVAKLMSHVDADAEPLAIAVR